RGKGARTDRLWAPEVGHVPHLRPRTVAAGAGVLRGVVAEVIFRRRSPRASNRVRALAAVPGAEDAERAVGDDEGPAAASAKVDTRQAVPSSCAGQCRAASY